jgi:transposase
VSFFIALPPCLIGIEASGSAHYWARVLGGLGHTVRLMAPQFVKPYVKSQKNDANDAEAICEAVTRPHMRFVPQKIDDADHRILIAFQSHPDCRRILQSRVWDL